MTRIGFIGGGQLGRMSAEESLRYGLPHTFVFLDPSKNCPASRFGEQIVGPYDSTEHIAQLASQVDVITFEIERSNYEALCRARDSGVQVYSSPESLQLIKDKHDQKAFLQDKDIRMPEFVAVKHDERDVKKMLAAIGGHAVLKVRNGAYDGRGNYVLESADDIPAAFEFLNKHAPTLDDNLYLEAYIDFAGEVSAIVGRDTHGNVDMYPIGRNVHIDGQLYETTVPALISPRIERQARAIAERVVKAIDGVGIFGVEMFVGRDGYVYFNEIAPRVHNSGHYTIEAAHASQFIQHIRAVTGQKLADFTLKHPAACMRNIVGGELDDGPYTLEGVAEAGSRGVAVHDYGKRETRPRRKTAHKTTTGETVEEAVASMNDAGSLVSIVTAAAGQLQKS